MADGTLRERVERARDGALGVVTALDNGEAVNMSAVMSLVTRLGEAALEAVADAEQVAALTLPEVGEGSAAFALGQARALVRDALKDIAEVRESTAATWVTDRLALTEKALKKAMEVSE